MNDTMSKGMYVTSYFIYDNSSQNLITTVAPSKTSSLPSVPRSTTTTAMSAVEVATENFMHELLSMNGDKEKMEDQVRSSGKVLWDECGQMATQTTN